MAKVSSNPTSRRFVQAYNEYGFLSLNSALLKPEVYQKILNENGGGERFLDFLEAAGDTYTMSSRTLKILSKGQSQRVVRNNAQIATGAAGADVTFVVYTGDRTTLPGDDGVYIQVGDVLLCPADYQTAGEPRTYFVSAYNTSTYTATLKPFAADGNTITQAQIGTAVPAQTEWVVLGSKHGFGTGQPDGRVFVISEREYKTDITKDSY
jgi:hypothetical protein